MSWPHVRQLYTCSWESLTVACRSQLGRQDLVLPISGACVWLLIAPCDSAGTKAGTFMAATPTSMLQSSLIEVVSFSPFIYPFFWQTDI